MLMTLLGVLACLHAYASDDASDQTVPAAKPAPSKHQATYRPTSPIFASEGPLALLDR